ncbi:MAG: hypothetical protein JHC84_18870, partial [Solirubrobacteraceae bacterium]|nr:hypothetical protein [Solirubrobacteraceae bacterium]
RGYGAGARILSVGIALTGVVTFAYFSLASHGLSADEYSRISILWSVLFVVVTVLYRPIEQLLSRTIAERRALGHGSHPLREPLLIQTAFAALFLVAALALRGPIQDDLLDGSESLYWILVAAVLAYAASYFARGWLAGHQRFELYGGLVFLEATTRVLFALAVVLGLASGQTAVAIGMVAAPCVSLIVVPLAFSRNDPPASQGEVQEAEGGLSLRHGIGFAAAVLVVMAAEQTLINGAVIAVDITSTDAALAGIVFSILLIARAPLQLFQAIQGSLLPHLAGLNATEDGGEFSKAIRVTVLAIAGFAAAVAIGLAAVGPFAMDLLFDLDYDWSRVGLAIVAVGMGLHLAGGTLNQAALARGHAREAAVAWAIAGVAFMVWMFAPVVDDEVLRAELGYALAAGLLCALLTVVYRLRPAPEAAAAAHD